ncbi:uncharacterized protein LOC102075544 isoform X1 [Oreochromis niloticus]|uniref:uncharacterized protein LOC102075544 isoform X1 n=2 Tax=Oreochromis niloticus TaxID=8128 RepID=UPI0003942383|nr:uncharacterized protein LOC102075544 isoform X1 [Oreochromis niloticus]XP_019215801.1 uncharacterized protein LOC102075544 isoform X1 [Oreochromis niloticus]XP_019215802.1 uncharacterized protein LOC102075544 isoform X1 [Oreochromis niloticus]
MKCCSLRKQVKSHRLCSRNKRKHCRQGSTSSRVLKNLVTLDIFKVMLFNSSSFATVFPAPTSRDFFNSSNSTVSFYALCRASVPSIVIYTMYTFTNILVLCPLYICILYMGFQHWRRQCSASAGRTMSLSDFFTYNMMILEMFGVFGSVLYCLSKPTSNDSLMMLGIYLFCVVFPGQTFFHVLTCVERYLAVVHPINYMHVREVSRVRIKNICTLCVWLICVGWVGIVKLYYPNFPMVPFLSLGICLLVIIVCCVFVLRALTRPGPGHKDRVDQSKQRAFYMITAITGVMLLRTAGLVLCFVIETRNLADLQVLCWLLDLVIWLSVPSSLVLPLLFLHRTGKLSGCRKKTESG